MKKEIMKKEAFQEIVKEFNRMASTLFAYSCQVHSLGDKKYAEKLRKMSLEIIRVPYKVRNIFEEQTRKELKKDC